MTSQKEKLNNLDRWPYLTTNILSKQKFNGKRQFIPKRSYSLTSHINMFEVCRKKYEFHVEYEFSPSRSASRTFGNLIHQTNEDIHKIVPNGNLANITNESVRTLFESNYRSLLSIGMRPLTKQHMNRALDHVLDYFNQNYDILSSIVKSEEEISVEKSEYILTGKIDLLLEKKMANLRYLTLKQSKNPMMKILYYNAIISNFICMPISLKKDMENIHVDYLSIGLQREIEIRH